MVDRFGALIRRSGAGRVLAALSLPAALVACSTSATPPAKKTVRAEEPAFLVSPMRGYPRSLSAVEAESLRAAHRGLLSSHDANGAVEAASMLLDSNPALEPAVILLAQADFVNARYLEALERAAPVAERNPDYVAAQLVTGRSAEKLSRVEEAFEIYLRVASRSEVANQRARDLRPRALEIAANRTRESLARRHFEEAELELARLQEWAPDELATFELEAEYAEAVGRPDLELAAVKRLLEFEPSDDLIRRRARLEMEAGDAGQGLRILEDLTQRYPDDLELALELERAKFRWRLDLLPAETRDILKQPELTRADFAKLLFWIFPDVRYGRPTAGRIASDILDHPFRTEIARVVNLDLMWLDRTLHLFHPERSLSRGETLEVLLRVVGGRNPRPACLASVDPTLRMSVDRMCGLAARCGLLAEPGDCLPEALASGAFVESAGFAALDFLGVE